VKTGSTSSINKTKFSAMSKQEFYDPTLTASGSYVDGSLAVFIFVV
jgi:hypothetical protein